MLTPPDLSDVPQLVGCEDWKWKILSSVLLFLHLHDLCHLTGIIRTRRGKHPTNKTHPPDLTRRTFPWLVWLNLSRLSHTSMSCLVSKHLCEAEHISTQLNCPSIRDHTISFMLFPLKPHPNFLVLPWLPYSRIFFLWRSLKKIVLPQSIYFCLFSYLLSHSKVPSWLQSLPLPIHSLPSWAPAHCTVARSTSLSKSPVLQNTSTFILSAKTSHRNSTSRKSSKINTRYPHLPVTCPCHRGFWFSAWIIHAYITSVQQRKLQKRLLTSGKDLQKAQTL